MTVFASVKRFCAIEGVNCEKSIPYQGSWTYFFAYPSTEPWRDFSALLANDLESRGIYGRRWEDVVNNDLLFSKVCEGIYAHITEMVGNFAAHLTRDEMAYGAQERGLNWGSIRAPDELVDEGHLNDRGFWVEVPHPELDRSFKYPGPAGIYNGSPWRISRRAPLIGEHNEEIYCGELGLQRTELAYLAESGVV